MQKTEITAVHYTPVPVQDITLDIEQPSNSTGTNMKRTAAFAIFRARVFMTCVVLLILVSVLVVPALQLIVSRLYKHQCPIQPKIPFFLFVSGLISIVAIYFPMIELVVANRHDINPILSRMSSIATVLFGLLRLIWLIYGAILIFDVFFKVGYDEKYQENYCHRTFYVLSIILLLMGFLQPIGQYCCRELKCHCW